MLLLPGGRKKRKNERKCFRIAAFGQETVGNHRKNTRKKLPTEVFLEMRIKNHALEIHSNRKKERKHFLCENLIRYSRLKIICVINFSSFFLLFLYGVLFFWLFDNSGC